MENTGENLKASLLQNFSTKERSVNFAKSEVVKLEMLINKYKHILMCKKTDGTSTKHKEQVWSSIHKEFNATGQIPRTLKQLKYKFENMKRSAKKEATKERQEMIRTGGGKPPTLPPESEDAADWLRSVMSVSIDGNESIYDDDVMTPNPDSINDADKTIIAINIDDEEVNFEPKKPILLNNKEAISVLTDADITDLPQNAKVECQKSSELFDCSTPHSSLKKPISGPLKRQLCKRMATDNVIKRTLREQKISVLKELNVLEMDRLKLSIANQRELHEQTIRHNEEKHKLEIVKLQLEIDTLKENLSKNH